MDRLTSIWQQLQSLTFYPFSLNWFGNPAIEAGDWLTLQDTKGNKFNVPNNGYTMTFDGSLSAVSKADQTSTSSSSYAWRGELSQYVADLGGRQGASGNYIYGTDTTEPPYGAKFNDIWYKQNGNKVELWTYERQADGTGKWVLTVSDATGEEVKAKVDQVELEAKASTDAAKAASDKADQLAAKYDDTNALANQALDQAIDAQNSTAGLIDDVNKASQNADDAKSIANSVNSKYTSLTDGSTMTIAELENGLAVKLTKDDLSGYATETWTQNQIKVSDDIINSTLSSVKTTVDGHTTSINSLKADSSGFKAQFITVNDTLGKQTKDIGTLQATNKSLSAGFDSLNADNTVNQHNISQLQLTATSLSNTIENVNQKVEDGLISTNIFRSANDFSRSYWTDTFGYPFTTIQSESRYHDSLIHYQGQGKTPAPYSTIAQQTITDNAMAADTWYTLSFYARGAGDNNTVGKFGMYFYGNGSDQSMSSSDGVEVLGTSDTHCIITLTPYFRRYVITFHTPKDFSGGHSFWARNDLDLNDGSLYCDFWHPKLELGKVASDFSVNPADTATISALSSISQTVDAIQTTVRGKVDNDTYQSKVVQLSNQITSVVGQVNTFGKRNIVTNSLFQYNYLDGTSWTGGTTAIWYKSDYAWSWVNGYQGICINQPISTNTDTSWYNLFSRKIVIGSDISTPWSASAYVNVDTVGFNTILIVEFYNTSGVRIGYKEVYKKSGGLQLMKVENAIPPAGTETVCFSFRVHGGGHVAMICPMLNQGTTAAAFVPDNATDAQVQQSYSAILQTQDMISLRVEKNGVINAVNVSSEGIQIYGNKLHITAATYIDNAIIKDAMIANLSANKITAGTINAANINVINLNANNITTGTINGSNLSINLNTGNVQFQAGRIHSADNGIDININSKYISVANNNNRVFISGGEIQMIQPQLFSQQTTPYVRINNAGAGSSWGGATFWARDYFAVTHQHNDGDIFSSPLGTERFSGISGGHSTTGWQVTKIGGAERGVFISGGKEFYTGGIDVSPYIRIGDTGHAGTGMNGSNITMEGNYIYIVSPHTSSHAANAYLASDGALVQSTSAAKYKTDIVRSFETGMGDKLLEVPIAHWKDKEEVLAKTLNPSAKNPDTYFGMIADDLDDAGLNELVDYDDKGKVRGIQYDRVALSLIPLIRNYRDRITELETKVKEMKEA
ncbi:hypothetical protein TUA1478L_33500 [Lactiplantibacillus plantarum]